MRWQSRWRNAKPHPDRDGPLARLRFSSLAARVNAERIVLLGWSRAILLQVAHPLVAAGVAEHSSFRQGRFAAAYRLHHTVRSMLSLTFGTEPEREATLALIKGIHRRVNGVLAHDAGIFRAGTRYSAEDPALLLWVHATLLESIPLVYERVIAPLTSEERDTYCREAAPLVQALGAPSGAPVTWEELRDYFARTYASGAIVVTHQAREIAARVLSPPFASALAPAAYLNRLVTIGTLPPDIRAQYGFGWNDRRQRALERWFGALRAARRVMPDVVALWPEARKQVTSDK
jgi:uncharacterized protein (DUF2236 family)